MDEKDIAGPVWATNVGTKTVGSGTGSRTVEPERWSTRDKGRDILPWFGPSRRGKTLHPT